MANERPAGRPVQPFSLASRQNIRSRVNDAGVDLLIDPDTLELSDKNTGSYDKAPA